jgi:putative transposase
MLTAMKKEVEWLTEVNAQSLQGSLQRLDAAYNNFFNKRAKFPKFKNKHAKQSFLVPQHFSLDPESETIKIPKFSPIKTVLSRKTEGTMKSITISKTPTGKYFASVLCEIDKPVKPKTRGGEIGIDLGLKSFLVASDKTVIDAPRFLRSSEKKLVFFQRHLSRKVKGGKNRDKARHKVALIHEKIANQRKDFLHQTSRKLVNENQVICFEDLNIKGMLANHKLAKSISDVGWSEFIRQIKYKSEWEGVRVGQIDRFFPSSKRHFECGWVNESLKLSDREWACKGCGATVDRDHNASQNILLFGKKQIPMDSRESTLVERRCIKAPRRSKKCVAA